MCTVCCGVGLTCIGWLFLMCYGCYLWVDSLLAWCALVVWASFAVVFILFGVCVVALLGIVCLRVVSVV